MSPIIEAMNPSPNSDRQSCASLGELFPKNGTAFATESPTTFVSSRPTIFGSSRRPGILDWRLEREFATRQYADSHRTILRRGESSCAGAEVVCDEFFAHFGWACSHAVQTVVAHIKELLSWRPPKNNINRKDTAAHQ